MVFTGTLPPVRGLVLFPVQILGGICAAAVVEGLIPAPIQNVSTLTAPNISDAQGLFIEMFLTAMLIFTILMLAAEKSKDTFIAPIGIGLALFISEIAGVNYTGASLNPSRSFGPCVVSGKFPGNHWIYWIGPFLGALVSGGYFHFVKFFNYEDANPGQDSAGGQFEEITLSRSGTGANEGSQMEQGQMEQGQSPPRTNGQSRSQSRPQLDSRIESGTLHPGFEQNDY